MNTTGLGLARLVERAELDLNFKPTGWAWHNMKKIWAQLGPAQEGAQSLACFPARIEAQIGFLPFFFQPNNFPPKIFIFQPIKSQIYWTKLNTQFLYKNNFTPN